MWLSDDRCVPIVITNLSLAGFTASTDVAPPPRMTEFGIELSGLGVVRAQIRWIDDGEFGSQFGHPLTEAQFSSL